MKWNRIAKLFCITLTLFAAYQSQAEEKIHNSSTSQLLKVPVSDYAMDYLPDLRIQFTSSEKMPFLLGSEEYYGTAFEFTFRSGEKSHTAILATLKNPTNYSSDENPHKSYPDSTQLNLRLWDLYSSAIQKGVSPKNLKVRLKIIKKYGSSSSSYVAGEYELPSILEEISLNPTAQKLANLDKQKTYFNTDIHFSVSIVGYKAKLFDEIWSWNQLLPANSLLSSRFLNLYAQTKTQGQRKSANIGDLLDVFTAYAQDQANSTLYKWPQDEELKSTKNSSLEVAQHIHESVKNNSGIKEYWGTLADHMSNVVDNIQMDLSSQRNAIESLMSTYYPAGTIVQINSMTDITNNIENNFTATSVVRGSNGLNLSDSAIEAYYSRKLRLERIAAINEQIDTTWTALKEGISNQLR